MLKIWKKIEEIEKLLKHEEITGYRIQINTKEKNYLLDKPELEEEENVTNAIGFKIPSPNAKGCEIEHKICQQLYIGVKNECKC